jgi:serine/threonine protein kinase
MRGLSPNLNLDIDVCWLDLQHDKSILHLDLKPGNVLLTWDEGKLVYELLIHPRLFEV